jgi:hypothetical protein
MVPMTGVAMNTIIPFLNDGIGLRVSLSHMKSRPCQQHFEILGNLTECEFRRNTGEVVRFIAVQWGPSGNKTTVSKEREYRAYAGACGDLANKANNDDERKHLLAMAEAWLSLRDRVHRPVPEPNVDELHPALRTNLWQIVSRRRCSE